MIFAVTEWFDNQSTRFYFDSSRVNHNQPFEMAYLVALHRAANNADRTLDVSRLAAISARYDTYQDGMSCWESLKAHPPCQVDEEVELIHSSP
jgi:hypothetical protein